MTTAVFIRRRARRKPDYRDWSSKRICVAARLETAARGLGRFYLRTDRRIADRVRYWRNGGADRTSTGAAWGHSLGGAVFLFLYGLRAFHAAWKGPGHLHTENGESQTLLSAVSTVLALSLLNPHVYLDTVVLLGGIGARYGWPGNAWFAAGAMCSSIIWFTALGFGARLLQPLFEKDISWRVLDVIVGIVMWWIAGALIVSR